MLIENRPGAGGSLGAGEVAKGDADGSVLLMGHIGTLAVNPAIYPRLGYDPLKSFVPVAGVAGVPNVLIGERCRPDLALVPIGGNFTMNPEDAAWAVKDMIRPKAVVPMHDGASPLAKGTAAQFTQAMGASPVRVIVATPGQALRF